MTIKRHRFLVAAFAYLMSFPAFASTPIALTSTTWVQIAAAGATVQVQNISTAAVRLSVSASAPSSTFDGEVLYGLDTDRKFDAPLPNALWAIAVNGQTASIAVNPIGANGGSGGGGSSSPVVPIGNPNIATNQVSVSTTATVVVAARTGRGAVTIVNTSTTAADCGGSGVTATTGMPLPGVVGASITIPTSATVYCITASGTTMLGEMETY